nr:MAG TPA: hypothetical protein [Caudoviricetes sp.]
MQALWQTAMLAGNKRICLIASLLHKGSLACLRLGTPLTTRKPI